MVFILVVFLSQVFLLGFLTICTVLFYFSVSRFVTVMAVLVTTLVTPSAFNKFGFGFGCRSAASERHLNGEQQQQRSCSDLSGVNYPGDLLSDAPRARPRRAVPPPLVKRNTVADFANTKAYQASTASLISASEQGAQAH